ncbi:hypothetical protein LBMAG24_07440 [Bacteroidota bacterium]|nr:hypothetical protein LBMAG24_07440 [Bacteroidota bacterium]
MIEEEKIDQLLKNKLESLETKVPRDAWKNFSEKWNDTLLDDQTAEEKKFDQKIYEKLNQFIFSTNEGHAWAHFHSYYSHIKSNENKIIWFKAMEVTMAVLLFFTCLHVGVIRRVPASQSVNIENKTKVSVDKYSSASNEINLVENGIQNKSYSAQTDRILSKLSDYQSDEGRNKLLPQKVMLEIEPIPSSPASVLKMATAPIYSKSFSEISQIPTLASRHIPISTRKIYVNNILDFGKWHLTLLTGLDGDNVFTPAYPRFKVPETIRNSSGFHLGFLLSEGAKRLETGFGFIYANKEYNAPAVTFIQGSLRDGYTTEQLKKIQLNLLQIPVFTRFNIVHKENWRIYATLGATAQVTLSANYFIVHPGFFPSSVALTGKSNSVYQNLEEGLMQGGTLIDNVYLSMDMGVGAEKMISPRMSIFAQSSYQSFVGHVSKGIGPYNDRISTVSFQSGVRINLFQPIKN